MTTPLPLRDGVGPSSVWLPDGPWKTVLEFLIDRFSEIRASTWVTRMEKGDVVDENGTRLFPDSSYRSGVRLYYYRELEREVRIPFEEAILYRDDHILVVDKPHFLPVVPAGRFVQESLLVRLKRNLALDFLVPIHRIDRETAGLVIFSIKPESRGAYHSLFEKRVVGKTYEALAPLLPGATFPIVCRSRIVAGQPFFRMQEVEGTPNSETQIDLVEIRDDVALYRLTPVTGKKHQLRVHLASLGIPIVNDPLYPRLTPDKGDDFSRPLQLLARALTFADPLTGESKRFESLRMLSTK